MSHFMFVVPVEMCLHLSFLNIDAPAGSDHTCSMATC